MIMRDTAFFYEDIEDEKAQRVRITGAQYVGEVLEVPASLDGKTVAAIGKKAFWGCTGVKEASVPESVGEIGDWAFASCKELRRVSLPQRQIQIGRGVFRGCEHLECIELCGASSPDGTGQLLAAGDRLLQNPYLLDMAAAGTAEWYQKWDASLRKLLRMPEDEGFSKMLLCGEEDYGSRENNLDHYCAGQRKKKASAVLLRLRYDAFLSTELRRELTAFLKSHTLGCETAEAWEALTEEHGDDRSYYDLFEEAGGIHDKNREQCIAALGDSHTEMKAYLLGKTVNRGGDFFDSLSI